MSRSGHLGPYRAATLPTSRLSQLLGGDEGPWGSSQLQSPVPD